MSAIAELQETIERVAAKVGPSVVGLGRGWHPGSGVVIGPSSVLTNAHNVRREELTVMFADGRSAPATVRGVDADRDLAVLSVDAGDAVPVEWAPATAGLGAPVVALANPGGRGLRVTLGFVSSAERSFRGPRGRRITGCLEHTAPLPRGSSGGPLVDPAGRLLGLNAIRLEGGLIVAVPADGASRGRVEALSRGEGIHTVRLGVAVAPPHVARRMRRAVGLAEEEGVLIRSVRDGSPAARAGIERGDLIQAAAGRPLASLDTLYEALDSSAPGGELQLTVVRGTETKDVTVSFDEAAEEVTR